MQKEFQLDEIFFILVILKMSLGFISLKSTKSLHSFNTVTRETSLKGLSVLKDASIEEQTEGQSQKILGKKGWYAIQVLLSIAAVVTTFAIGLLYIPSDVLFVFDGYFETSVNVLQSMKLRLEQNIAITLFAWLAPIIPSLFIPLWFTGLPLSVISIALGIIMTPSLLSPEERGRFTSMLETEPHLGYMWYETVLILSCAILLQPSKFWLFWLGPLVSICNGMTTSQLNPFIFIFLAFLSIFLVLPTADRFINDDGEFFLLGYSTNSIYGTLLSIGFVCIWVKTYHLVCRGCLQSWKASSSVMNRIITIIWLLVGTALVELWVSSAFALHLAFTSYMRLTEEVTFWELKVVQYNYQKIKLYFK